MKSGLEENVYIQMFPDAFIRILNNVFINAIKYNKKGGQIHLSLKSDSNFVYLIIKDTGRGIPPGKLKDIFKHYYQHLPQYRAEYEGIGAGLPLVKGLLLEVGAEIDISSRVNTGTSVVITFFKAEINKKNKNQVIEEITFPEPVKLRNYSLLPETFDKNKKTILVVDDSKKFLQLVQYGLIKKFNVYYALNGKEALYKLPVIRKPDIIFSDIFMPVMDGWTFFKKIREKKEYQDIPFIFITGRNSHQDKINGLKAGAVDYLSKPFHIAEMIEKANSLINAYEMNRKKEKERTFKDLGEIIDSKRKSENFYVSFEAKCDELQITPREKDVLRWVLKKRDNPDIADILCISIETVRSHMKKLYYKCGVKKRNDLIA